MKPVNCSGRLLTLESGLLESELASGVLLWRLCFQPVSAPLLSVGSCPLSTLALNPVPSQFLWSAPPTAWTNGRAEEACVREGEEVEKPSNLRAALQQLRAPGSSFSNAMGEHLVSCLLGMLGWPESEQVFLSSDIPACLLVYTPFLPDTYVHATTVPSPTSAAALRLYSPTNRIWTDGGSVLGFWTPNLCLTALNFCFFFSKVSFLVLSRSKVKHGSY